MSTKIYNGYIIDGITNLSDLSRFIKKIHDLIIPKFDEINADEFYTSIIRTYDKLSCGQLLGDWTRAVYFVGSDIIYEMRKEFDREPYFNIAFIYLDDKLLALYYCSFPEIKKLWESLDEVSPYWYWNNSDPDENCSEEEWAQRELDWDTALGYAAPCKVSFNYDPINHMNKSAHDCILKSKLSAFDIYDDRVNDCVTNITHAYYLEHYNDEKTPYTSYSEYRKWRMTDEGQKVIAYYNKKIRWRLSRNIKLSLFTDCASNFISLKSYHSVD